MLASEGQRPQEAREPPQRGPDSGLHGNPWTRTSVALRTSDQRALPRWASLLGQFHTDAHP